MSCISRGHYILSICHVLLFFNSFLNLKIHPKLIRAMLALWWQNNLILNVFVTIYNINCVPLHQQSWLKPGPGNYEIFYFFCFECLECLYQPLCQIVYRWCRLEYVVQTNPFKSSKRSANSRCRKATLCAYNVKQIFDYMFFYIVKEKNVCNKIRYSKILWFY